MKPDLVLYAALVHQGVFTDHEADALVKTYGDPRTYDAPVPINVESALVIACDAIHGSQDDEAITEMVNGESVENDDSSLRPPHWWLDAFFEWDKLARDE